MERVGSFRHPYEGSVFSGPDTEGTGNVGSSVSVGAFVGTIAQAERL